MGWGHILPKTPKMELISIYLAAGSSPKASADALAIIDNSQLPTCLIRPLRDKFVQTMTGTVRSITIGQVKTGYVISGQFGSRIHVFSFCIFD